MSKNYILGHNKSNQQHALLEKQKQQKYINERLPKLINFLEKHGHEDKLPSLTGYEDILNLFRPDYPFPKATDDKNLELLGIDTSSIKKDASILKSLKDGFILKGNQVEISEEWHKANEEKHTYRTKTEAEDKVFEYATKLAKLVLEGEKKGFLSKYQRSAISKNNSMFRINEETKEIKYNEFQIANIAKKLK